MLQCGYAVSKRKCLETDLKCVNGVRQFSGREFQSANKQSFQWRFACLNQFIDWVNKLEVEVFKLKLDDFWCNWCSMALLLSWIATDAPALRCVIMKVTLSLILPTFNNVAYRSLWWPIGWGNAKVLSSTAVFFHGTYRGAQSEIPPNTTLQWHVADVWPLNLVYIRSKI